MSPCVIKLENARFRFIQVLSAVNSSLEGRITLKLLQPVAKVLETLYRTLVQVALHDLVLMIPPPPLVKVASNTRSCSKLGGTTLSGREEGGECYISQTCD